MRKMNQLLSSNTSSSDAVASNISTSNTSTSNTSTSNISTSNILDKKADNNDNRITYHIILDPNDITNPQIKTITKPIENNNNPNKEKIKIINSYGERQAVMAYNNGLTAGYPVQGLTTGYPVQGLTTGYPVQGLTAGYPVQGLTTGYPVQGSSPNIEYGIITKIYKNGKINVRNNKTSKVDKIHIDNVIYRCEDLGINLINENVHNNTDIESSPIEPLPADDKLTQNNVSEEKYVLYNILTDEMYELDCEISKLRKMIEYLIYNKYNNGKKITDTDFIANCIHDKNKIITSIIEKEKGKTNQPKKVAKKTNKDANISLRYNNYLIYASQLKNSNLT